MGVSSKSDAVLTAYVRSLIQFKARQLARKPGFFRSDEEDLEQELTAHLLSRAHLFDPTRASANTFADRVIRTGIAMLLRDRGRHKRRGNLTTQSLERTVVDQEHGSTLRDVLGTADLSRRTGSDPDAVGQAELTASVLEVIESLPPDLKDICQRLMDGSAAGIARDLGISRRQLGKAIEQIRTHFEAAGLRDV